MEVKIEQGAVPPAYEIRLGERSATAHGPTAKIQIFYGNHHESTKAALPPATRALFLEGTPSAQWRDDRTHAYTLLSGHLEYGSIVAQAKASSCPVYFSDPGVSLSFSVFDYGLIAAEAAAAAGAFGAAVFAAAKFRQAEPGSRRRFLGVMTAGLAGAGVFLGAPMAVESLHPSFSVESSDAAYHTYRRTHPETFQFVREYRDLVMAYKHQWLLDSKLQPETGEPTVVSLLGRNHLGFERILQLSQVEKLRRLGAFSKYFPAILDDRKLFVNLIEHAADGTVRDHVVPELQDFLDRAMGAVPPSGATAAAQRTIAKE